MSDFTWLVFESFTPELSFLPQHELKVIPNKPWKTANWFSEQLLESYPKMRKATKEDFIKYNMVLPEELVSEEVHIIPEELVSEEVHILPVPSEQIVESMVSENIVSNDELSNVNNIELIENKQQIEDLNIVNAEELSNTNNIEPETTQKDVSESTEDKSSEQTEEKPSEQTEDKSSDSKE